MATAVVSEKKTTDQPAKLCTKCQERPRSGGESDANPWCKECRNAYQREYRDGQSWRDERRGIIRGIKGFRDGAAAHFKAWGNRIFNGAEVAFMLEQLPGPEVLPEDADKTKPQLP
jgi:hypothetical protein